MRSYKFLVKLDKYIERFNTQHVERKLTIAEFLFELGVISQSIFREYIREEQQIPIQRFLAQRKRASKNESKAFISKPVKSIKANKARKY